MSTKDYVAVAAVLADLKGFAAPNHSNPSYDSLTLYRVTQRMADLFADDNPRFNRERFYAAAGV